MRDFLRWSEQAAHEAGLTSSLHQLLLVIRGHPGPLGPTVGQAAQALHVRHHSAVELAQRAEASLLVRRQRDPSDHRVVRLKLTGHGRTVLETVSRRYLPRIQTLAETLEQVLHPEQSH